MMQDAVCVGLLGRKKQSERSRSWQKEQGKTQDMKGRDTDQAEMTAEDKAGYSI